MVPLKYALKLCDMELCLKATNPTPLTCTWVINLLPYPNRNEPDLTEPEALHLGLALLLATLHQSPPHFECAVFSASTTICSNLSPSPGPNPTMLCPQLIEKGEADVKLGRTRTRTRTLTKNIARTRTHSSLHAFCIVAGWCTRCCEPVPFIN